MPLQSKLFRNDPAFEACLINDSAHIIPGARGPHVNKIQTALFILDNFQVNPAELAQAFYGPSTSAGVLAYKTKRRIINTAYQQIPDNIVGKMTIASLDTEMLRAQTLPTPSPDKNDVAWTTRRA